MIREQLPYQLDSIHLLSALQPLGGLVMFDSGKDFAGHQLDLLAALPAQKLWHENQQTWWQSAPESTPLPLDNTEILSIMADQHQRHADPSLPPLPGPGWLGCIGYDAARYLTAGVRWHKPVPGGCSLVLGFYPCVLITDHQQRTTELVWLPHYADYADLFRQALSAGSANRASNTGAPFALRSRFEPTLSFNEYQSAYDAVQEYIRAGDCYQVNLTQRFSALCQGDALAAYRKLRALHHSPMGGFVDLGTKQLLSLSPERFVQGVGDQWVTHPIKGTAPRGTTPDKDAQLARELAASEKNRAENVMIVDLLRNDLGRFAVPGSVSVPSLCSIESYTNVHHLVSSIVAQRKPDVSQIDAFEQCFPGGSITGAPKLRAMEIIDELEAAYRDLYCGSMIMWSCTDYLDSNILIRSFVIESGQIACWAGGGIVADSDCASEYAESLTKIQTFMNSLELDVES